MHQKPYAESCDQNRDPILKILKLLFADTTRVLEIGSGTGQHAVYFARHLPHLIWHCSDRRDNHAGINQWLDEANLDNTRAPLALDVSLDTWPVPQPQQARFDALFSANAVHIMSWQNVRDFFKNAGRLLPSNGLLVLYGPFNYAGQYTSESNARFDAWLQQQNPQSAIRNFEDLDTLAHDAGLTLQQDFAMPANNRILCWVKR